MMLVTLIIASCCVLYTVAYPLPFYRDLVYDLNDLMKGDDVLIAQTLMYRDPIVATTYPLFIPDSIYSQDSMSCTLVFQEIHNLPSTGIVDSDTAQKILDLYSNDGITDSGFTAASLGYMYKVNIKVYSNRSIETVGTLFDANNNVLLQFPTRTHGKRDDDVSYPWPDFGNGDIGLNQFTSSGATITGIIEIDLNTPEPDSQVYGPWPVNRFVRGIAGNAALLLPNIRDGILIHTGNWTTEDHGTWNPTMSMPNSAGCIHSHPESVEKISTILQSIGVKANTNTYSGKNYPYKPQGIAVVELI
jgi:hypothetical protein